MLNLLPNELLVKIFEKTNEETTRNCRFVSSRFNNLINQFDIHNIDVEMLQISPTSWGRRKVLSISCILEIQTSKDGKTIQNSFESLSDLVDGLPGYLRKIGKINKLKLLTIDIHEKLVNVLLNHSCTRNLTNLHAIYCNTNTNALKPWFKFLEKQALEELRVLFSGLNKEAMVCLPPMIMKKVENYFEYNTFPSNPGNTIKIFDMSWLDDNYIEQWYNPDKMLIMPTCIISITIRGVLNCLQKLAKVYTLKTDMMEFGILKNETPASVKTVLFDNGVTYSRFRRDNPYYQQYQINYIRSQRVEAHFAVPLTEEDA